MTKPAAPAAPGALHQVAALPWRRTGDRLEVCLVTTRETARWTIPKGWPMKGRTDADAARREAEQEAGLVGKVADAPFGTFTYWKRREARFDLVRVAVYPLKVTKALAMWKEKAERRIHWLAIEDAALVVDEPELATLMTEFGAKGSKGPVRAAPSDP